MKRLANIFFFLILFHSIEAQELNAKVNVVYAQISILSPMKKLNAVFC
ncbi:MAG: hypothetical protein LW706_11445 [Chitinophagaceae bacterium]|nr:hypothetical protein [Chitinophagaceae bacterium]